jgi:hypothetical protein
MNLKKTPTFASLAGSLLVAGVLFAKPPAHQKVPVHEDSPDRFTVVEKVATRKGARTMALDGKTHTLYLSSARYGPAPEPTAEQPHPRPTVLPDSFTLLVVGPAGPPGR